MKIDCHFVQYEKAEDEVSVASDAGQCLRRDLTVEDGFRCPVVRFVQHYVVRTIGLRVISAMRIHIRSSWSK